MKNFIVIQFQGRNQTFPDNPIGQTAADQLTARLAARKIPYTTEKVANTKSRSKFKNVRCPEGDLMFDSKWERTRWRQLVALEKAGKISKLTRQKPYFWQTSYTAKGKTFVAPQKHSYVADFVYFDADGRQVVEDAKGMLTREYKTKRRIMKKLFGITILETRKKPSTKNAMDHPAAKEKL